jgi:hopanoid C-3 methylase
MERFRLLLVTPPYHDYNLADEKTYIVEPIQFEVLSSLLDPKKFEVRLLDMRIEQRHAAFTEAIKGFRPDAVGMSSWTMHVSSVRRCMAQVKQFDPRITTLVGGHHAGIAPADFADENIDYVMMGEGYQSFAPLMEKIRGGDHGPTTLVGVAYRQGDRFISNGTAVITRDFDLDTLPLPDRSLLGRYRSQYYHLWWKPIASLRSGLGCPSRCSFCNLWRPNRGKYLTWSPEYVVDYLRSLDESYVLFVDDHFFGDVRRAYEIGELILRSNIKKQYCLYSRSDAIAKHPELVEIWARIGLKRVRMGLESYSDKELDGLTKCNSVENNDKAIAILKQHRIFTEGLFMIGLDYTQKEFDELAAYIQSRKIEVPNITVYTPMPGTSEYERTKNDLRFSESEYFDFQHAVLKTTLDLKEFCHHYGKLLLKAQRPPHEQIQLVGLPLFLRRMPAFWRYFASVYRSHQHYQKKPYAEPVPGRTLPWQDSAPSFNAPTPGAKLAILH